MKNKTLYKFLRTGLKSESGNHTWKIGEWYHEDKVEICKKGFHASQTPLQALGYVRGEILAKVEVKGQHQEDDDKECWSDMRLFKAYHWTKEDSVELAIYAAELVIDIYEKRYPNDDRPRKAIEAAKSYLISVKSGNNDAADAVSAAFYAARAADASSAASAADAASAASAADAVSAAFYAARAADASSAASAAFYAARASDASSAAFYAARASDASSAASAARAASASLRAKINKWFIKKIKTLTPYE